MPIEEDVSWTWLDSVDVATWLKLDISDSGKMARVELATAAAASWVEKQRPDLVDRTVPGATEFKPSSRVVMAAILAAARLYARADSPNGVVAFDELGAGSILSKDPDVARMLGRAKWAVG